MTHPRLLRGRRLTERPSELVTPEKLVALASRVLKDDFPVLLAGIEAELLRRGA